MAEPTPGPWTIAKPPHPGTSSKRILIGSPSGSVAYVLPLLNEAEAEANARLIAKARHLPALIEALEGVRDWADEYDTTDPPFAAARAALALVQETE